MAATLVQTKSITSGGYTTDFNFSFGSSVTTGNFIVIALYHGGAATITSISDGSNTYNLIDDSGNSPPYADGSSFYVYNATGGALTINVQISDYAYVCGVAREYSGLITTDPLDKHAEHLDGGYVTSHSTGTTATTTQNAELVIAYYVSDNAGDSYTISGFSNKVEANNGTYGEVVMADKNQTSTGTQTGTFVETPSDSNGWAGIATFKEVVAGGSATYPGYMASEGWF